MDSGIATFSSCWIGNQAILERNIIPFFIWSQRNDLWSDPIKGEGCSNPIRWDWQNQRILKRCDGSLILWMDRAVHQNPLLGSLTFFLLLGIRLSLTFWLEVGDVLLIEALY